MIHMQVLTRLPMLFRPHGALKFGGLPPAGGLSKLAAASMKGSLALTLNIQH